MEPSRAVMSQAEPLIYFGRITGMGGVGGLNFNQGYPPLISFVFKLSDLKFI